MITAADWEASEVLRRKRNEAWVTKLRSEVHAARDWYSTCLLMGAGERFALRR